MPRTRSIEPTPTRSHARVKGRAPQWSALLMAMCLALAGLMSSCSQEGQTGAAPLGERAENEIPLNPPTLRFHVSAGGEVDASPDRRAETGEAVAIVLENAADSDYRLRLVGPEGDDVFTVEAPAHGRRDGRAMPRDVGTHIVEVYPAADPDAGVEFTVEVSET